MALPELSREQRAEALHKAAAARKVRAELKERLKRQEMSVADVLRAGDADEVIGKMRVSAVLEALPGLGKARAQKIMQRLGISPTRRVRGLGANQRRALEREFKLRPCLTGVPARLTVLSGPSGVGKGTVVAEVRRSYPDVWLSVSATTAPAPRPEETDGVEYHFVQPARFAEMVAAGEFLEWAEFAGNRYGTPARAVLEILDCGVPALLEIDPQGARQVRAAMPTAQLVFLTPPSWAELERRLSGRGTEPPGMVSARLRRARVELAARREFDVVICNDDAARAAEELVQLLRHPRAEPG